jgi:hypothetical protein
MTAAAGRDGAGEEGRIMAERPRAGDELRQMPHEPLLDVEKKLIGGSLIAGVILLGILVWMSYTFFPAH